MPHLYIPEHYRPVLTGKETEQAIVRIKNFFQLTLSTRLNLTRVTAPLFVPRGKGLNDDLNGTERAVHFPVKDMNEQELEIVHSLAKWKRVIRCMSISGIGNSQWRSPTERSIF